MSQDIELIYKPEIDAFKRRHPGAKVIRINDHHLIVRSGRHALDIGDIFRPYAMVLRDGIDCLYAPTLGEISPACETIRAADIIATKKDRKPVRASEKLDKSPTATCVACHCLCQFRADEFETEVNSCDTYIKNTR